MGVTPYCYFAPYQDDRNSALQTLRLQEFLAGRYDPALQAASPPTKAYKQTFPPDEKFPSPGAQHKTIDEALEAALESGTRTILDIFVVSEKPQFLCAYELSEQEAKTLLKKSKPTRSDIEKWLRSSDSWDFWDTIPRGEARIVVVYANDSPAEFFFAGCSVD